MRALNDIEIDLPVREPHRLLDSLCSFMPHVKHEIVVPVPIDEFERPRRIYGRALTGDGAVGQIFHRIPRIPLCPIPPRLTKRRRPIIQIRHVEADAVDIVVSWAARGPKRIQVCDLEGERGGLGRCGGEVCEDEDGEDGEGEEVRHVDFDFDSLDY